MHQWTILFTIFRKKFNFREIMDIRE